MSLRRFSVWTNLAISAALMLLVWTLLVWVASRPALRGLIDLTPQRVNTVSLATKEVLRDLRAEEAEVEFHVFRGEFGGVPRDDRHAQEMAIRRKLLDLTGMLLRRYAAIGGESVKVVHHDAYQDPAAYREAAQAFTYTAADTESLIVAVRQKGKERRFRKLSMVSDLAVIDMGGNAPTGAPGGRPALPILKDFQGEKAISSALKGLLVQGNPVVYVLKGQSVMVRFQNGDLDYGRLIEAMTQSGFDVRWLNLRQQGGVPTDADMVMCMEPTREFLTRDSEYLYAYLKRGGRLFVNYGWAATPDMNPTGGKLGELLGFEVSPGPVFHRIPDLGGRGGGSMDGTDAVARLSLQLNPSHPTTRRMAQTGRPIEVFMGREVRQRRDHPENVRLEELLRTGREGWLARTVGGRPDFRSPTGGLRNYTVGLACEMDPEGDGDASSSPRVGRAVVIAGAFCNNKAFPHFGDFALNICNWMTERRVLLDIATSRYTAESVDISPQQISRIRWLLIGYVPGAFLVMGLFMWWRRRH
jgi:hypothetical protein